LSWQKKKLSEVCVIRPPKSEAKKIVSSKDLVSFLGMEHLGISKKSVVPSVEKTFEEVSGSYTYFAENDVLLAKITPCFENGKLGIAKNLTNGIGFGSSEFVVFRTGNQIFNEWLYYFLSRADFLAEGANNMSGAVGHKRINKEFIESYEIPVPPLAIQKKIVSKLDAIFAEIDKATVASKANAKNAEALFQSYLNELFGRGGDGWIGKKLQEITTKIGSGATPKGGNGSYKETGISLIRSMNVYDDGFFYPKLAFIDDAQAKELANVTVEEDDILLNITGASVARCCIVPSDILPARVNQHVSILRAKKNVINPSLLHLLLISPIHKQRLLSVGEGGGTTRQAITKAQLQDYVIHFPINDVEQLKLVEKISEINSFTEKINSSFESKWKNLPILKQSILKQAFAGELVKE